VVVPIQFPSYDWSGDTHVLEIGDSGAWQLAVGPEVFMPSEFLVEIDAEAQPAADPLPPDYYPTLLVSGGLTAWWNAGSPPPPRVSLRCWFVMDSTQLDPEDIPTTAGTIRSLHAHFRAYAGGTAEHPFGGSLQRPEFAGFKSMASTTESDFSGMTAHAARPGLEWPEASEWSLMGWVAMVEVSD
jgi:hypothetical protein